MTLNLEFMTFIVPFEGESFIIARVVRYSSATSRPLENMRLIPCCSLRKTTHYAFKPRIIVPKYPSLLLAEISFVPIKGNRILLFAKYSRKETYRYFPPYLHLSIHEICSDNRVGPVLWFFRGHGSHGDLNSFHLKLIKSTQNALGITCGVRFVDHWKLFDISTTDIDASDNFPLTESGRIDFDLKFNWKWQAGNNGLSENFM